MDPKIWRPRIKRAAWGTILVSLVAFWNGYSAGSYIFWLIGTFLAVLGIAHLIYAEWKTIPILAVRLIDYVYVGFGAVAAFFALQGQYEREVYLRELSKAVTDIHAKSLPVPATREGLEPYVNSAINFFCINDDQLVISITIHFCDWAKGVQRFLANSFSTTDLASEIERSQEIASNEGWAGLLWCRSRYANPSRPHQLGELPQLDMDPFDVPPLNKYSDLLCTSSSRANHIIDVLQVMLVNEQYAMPLPLPPQQPSITIFGFFKSVPWPFLLAIALALRLTKVTADVTAWAVVPTVGSACGPHGKF